MTNWIEATNLLMSARSIVIVTHPRPDGDAIGSMLGLGNQIRTMGKEVICAVDEGVPAYLQFLPGAENVVSSLDAGQWDLCITTDVADETRAGQVGEYALAHAAAVINIDHHPTNPLFGDVPLVYPQAVSAAEVAFDWWEYLGVHYDRDVALPLLTGIVTDSQGFRTSSTSARTLEIAMHLMRRGASLTEVTARALESKTSSEFELWKRTLPGASLDGQVITAVVTLADAQAVGMDDTTDAGLVQFLINVEDARVACVFKERAGGQVGLSLRAKRGYDVAGVAVAFGGGGHIQAAGATINGTLADVMSRVIPLLHSAASKGRLDIV
jgi:phosphoesterase RecJ-like protein